MYVLLLHLSALLIFTAKIKNTKYICWITYDDFIDPQGVNSQATQYFIK